MNPFLKKYSFLYKKVINKSFRKDWTLEEDIRLLDECIENPKQWAKISRKLHRRNQHQIKNRFIVLFIQELNWKREKVRELIRENKTYFGPISLVLEGLKLKNSNEKEKIEKLENEEKDAIRCNVESNIDRYLNFEQGNLNSSLDFYEKI